MYRLTHPSTPPSLPQYSHTSIISSYLPKSPSSTRLSDPLIRPPVPLSPTSLPLLLSCFLLLPDFLPSINLFVLPSLIISFILPLSYYFHHRIPALFCSVCSIYHFPAVLHILCFAPCYGSSEGPLQWYVISRRMLITIILQQLTWFPASSTVPGVGLGRYGIVAPFGGDYR